LSLCGFGAIFGILSIFLNGSRTGCYICYGIGCGNASVSLLPFVPSLLASCVWLADRFDLISAFLEF
jgi:hypothetical protein